MCLHIYRVVAVAVTVERVVCSLRCRLNIMIVAQLRCLQTFVCRVHEGLFIVDCCCRHRHYRLHRHRRYCRVFVCVSVFNVLM